MDLTREFSIQNKLSFTVLFNNSYLKEIFLLLLNTLAI